MKSFNFKRRNLFSGPHLLGSLLVVAGLFALASPAFLESQSSEDKILGVGIGTLAIGLVIISSFDGTFIDFTKKRFKEYMSIGGYKFGEWTALPHISTVKVISNSYRSTNTPNGISPTLSGKVTVYKLLVYSSSSQPFFTFTYNNKDKAMDQAKSLATHFNVKLELSEDN